MLSFRSGREVDVEWWVKNSTSSPVLGRRCKLKLNNPTRIAQEVERYIYYIVCAHAGGHMMGEMSWTPLSLTLARAQLVQSIRLELESKKRSSVENFQVTRSDGVDKMLETFHTSTHHHHHHPSRQRYGIDEIAVMFERSWDSSN